MVRNDAWRLEHILPMEQEDDMQGRTVFGRNTGIGSKVGPRLREFRLLAPSGHGASSRNLGPTF